MAYIGNSPQQAVRQRYYYTATASQTTFTGADIYGLVLKYTDSEYVDVFLNGVLLQKQEDYTATTRTSIVLTAGAQAGDLIEIVSYGVFSVSDTVSASRGGTFSSSININSNLVVTGNVNVATNLAVTGNLTVGTGSVVITNNTVTIAGSAVSPVQSFRNKIINGNFQYWQRGTSTTTAGYLADRWQTNTSGSTFTASRQSFTLGQTAVPNEPTYFHRTVVTSVAGAGNYCLTRQYIESVRTLAGQTATLSFWAKADSAKNIAIDLAQSFGTGGSPSTGVTGISVTTCALTTTFQKFTIPITFPSISGKTLGSNNDDYVEVNFWFDCGSSGNARTNSLGQQSGTFDIAQVQLEAGNVATPFEVRPFQTEFALCQRYYQIFTIPQCYLGGLSSVTQIYTGYSLPVAMRISPTASVSTQFQYYSGGGGVNITPTFAAQSTSTFTVYSPGGLTSVTGMAAGAAALTAEL